MSFDDYSTKVTIAVAEKTGLDEYPDCNWTISFDGADFTPDQWFKVFEKLLIQVGFSEVSVMEGAASLAFNECRSTEEMQRLYNKLELEEFAPKSEEVNEATF